MMFINALDEIRESVLTKPVNETELQGVIRYQAAEIWEERWKNRKSKRDVWGNLRSRCRYGPEAKKSRRTNTRGYKKGLTALMSRAEGNRVKWRVKVIGKTITALRFKGMRNQGQNRGRGGRCREKKNPWRGRTTVIIFHLGDSNPARVKSRAGSEKKINWLGNGGSQRSVGRGGSLAGSENEYSWWQHSSSVISGWYNLSVPEHWAKTTWFDRNWCEMWHWGSKKSIAQHGMGAWKLFIWKPALVFGQP